MEDIIRAIGLYDLVGYLLPGCVAVFSVRVAVDAFLRSKGHRLTAANPVVFLLAAYLAGFMAQFVLSPNREPRFLRLPLVGYSIDQVFERSSVDYQSLMRHELFKTFGQPPIHVPDIEPKEQFLMAEAYVRARQLDSFPAIMQARHAFSRGPLLCFMVALLCFGGIFIAFQRAVDFDRYQKEAVFRLFYADHVTNPARNVSPSAIAARTP